MRNAMYVVTDLRSVVLPASSVVIIGKFDGVHIGHLAVLQKAVQMREELRRAGAPGARLVALSFDPLPSMFFDPGGSLKLINSPPVRSSLLLAAGADLCVMQTFDECLANLSATAFVDMIKTHLHMKVLVIGQDFALGKNRQGTGPMLQRWGRARDFEVRFVGDVRQEGYVVRSNTIRQLLHRGEVGRASDHLGRDHFVVGRVKSGVKLARKLGFPTANLTIDETVCYPRSGVYATWIWIQDPFGIHPSVTNLGFRPTFNGREYRLETHLLDYPPDISEDHLYGQRVAVSFAERLRPEIKFESVEELAAQVQSDIHAARRLLARKTDDGLVPRVMAEILQRDPGAD